MARMSARPAVPRAAGLAWTHGLSMRLPLYLFRRVVSGGQFLPELDGLRFLAIVPVVLFHATMSLYLKHAELGGSQVSAIDGSRGDAVFRSAVGWIVSHGFLGVQLFFLISGFVVTLPFARHHLLGARAPRLQAFYLKRLTRIEPPYFLALCLFAIGVLAAAPEHFRIADFASGLLFLRTALFGNEPWAFFISWSLEIEVQFYLLAPILASVFAIRGTAARRAILVVAIAAGAAYAARVRLAGSEDPPLGGPLQHGTWLGTEIAFFLAGMLVADLWTMREERTGRRTSHLAWDALALVGIVGIYASYRLLELPPPLGTTASMAALVGGTVLLALGAFRGRIVRVALVHPAVTAIGGACYTIYLLHFLVISMAGRFIAPHVPATFEAMVAFAALPFSAAVILACLCAFPVVERPFMFADWPRIAWNAVRTARIRPLAALFAERARDNT